jgi:DNA (cytosine-5)-methyltransferase 1
VLLYSNAALKVRPRRRSRDDGPRLLDLFCGAGGSAAGYFRTGFTEIVGIDIRPQPRYPFTFLRCDWRKYLRKHWREFDAIHASPPCQCYTQASVIYGREHPDLVPAVRRALSRLPLPWVMENVPGAPMADDAITLCGSSFGLGVRRHRLFEASFPLGDAPPCRHESQPSYLTPGFGHSGVGAYVSGKRRRCLVPEMQEAMKIDWMTRKEMAQAVPPVFAEWVGERLIGAIREAA